MTDTQNLIDLLTALLNELQGETGEPWLDPQPEEPPICPPPSDPVPEPPWYFDGPQQLFRGLYEIMYHLGKDISARGLYYNRALFYGDSAMVLRQMRSFGWLNDSLDSWNIYIALLEDRAKELGDDVKFNHPLPELGGDAQKWLSAGDLVARNILGAWRAEYPDLDVPTSPAGLEVGLTVGECAKLHYRFARRLEMWCYDYVLPTPAHSVGWQVTWPWLEKVQIELAAALTEMGEVTRAGSANRPGGFDPGTFSWPGGG